MPNSLHSNKYVIIAYKQGQWSYFYRKRQKKGFQHPISRKLRTFAPASAHAVAVDLVRVHGAVKKRGRSTTY